MRIQRTSQIITVIAIALSALSIACALAARACAATGDRRYRLFQGIPL